MGNHKRWVQRGGGDFLKWETVGQTLEGIWQGTKPGKFGDLGMIDAGGGGEAKVFPLHTALALLCEGLKIGTEVRIEYLGEELNARTGREFKAFNVYEAKPEEGATPGATPDAAQAAVLPVDPADDDIPF